MRVGNVDLTRKPDFTNVLSFPADFQGDFKIWRYGDTDVPLVSKVACLIVSNVY